jgi:hypothetical protein
VAVAVEEPEWMVGRRSWIVAGSGHVRAVPLSLGAWPSIEALNLTRYPFHSRAARHIAHK